MSPTEQKTELTRYYEGATREAVATAFETDRSGLRAEEYVAVAEHWSEPLDDDADGRLDTDRLNRSPGVVSTHLGVGGANIRAATPLARYRLEVRYAPAEQAARSQGGELDITVTENGRCPTCKELTLQMPRPPFERYCNRCNAEFSA